MIRILMKEVNSVVSVKYKFAQQMKSELIAQFGSMASEGAQT